jgi:hypothetical protein
MLTVRTRPASNLPATKPHVASASIVWLHCDLCAEQHRYEATRGCTLKCERLARLWHARSQGFYAFGSSGHPERGLTAEKHGPWEG